MQGSILQTPKKLTKKRDSLEKQVDLDDLSLVIRSLEHERSSWEAPWLDIRDNIYPEGARALDGSNTSSQGGKKQQKVLDSTPQLAIRSLASGMQGGIISPSRQWFQLGLKGQEKTTTSVTGWLTHVRDILLHFFNEADIYGAMYQLFREMALYGQGVILIEEDLFKGFKFTTLSCGDYWLDSNDDSEVDTLMRKMYYSARDMIRRFGKEILPEEITQKESINNVEKKFEVIHIIRPREEYEYGKRDNTNMEWESLYLYKGGNNAYDSNYIVLRQSGFRNKPFVAPRWEKLSNATYGSSPARIALADVKTLYQVRKEALDGLKKTVSPPVAASGKLKNESIQLIPNGVTYVNSQSVDSQITPIYQAHGVYEATTQETIELRQKIKEVFFNDLFAPIMNKDKSMSATEVTSINAEKLGSITPVIELLEKEALDHVFDRCFQILYDLGDVIPPVPAELQGRPLKIEYVSVLAQAQKQSELTAIMQLIGNVAMMAELRPDSSIWLDIGKIISKMAEILCQSELLLPEKEVKKLQQIQEDLAREQQASQAIQETVSTAKEVGEINSENIDNLAQNMGVG